MGEFAEQYSTILLMIPIALAAREAGRVGGDRIEDHVGHDRHSDEKDHRPQEAPDQVAKHESGL